MSPLPDHQKHGTELFSTLPQLAPKYLSVPPILALPTTGLSSSQVSDALTALSELPNTKWEDGHVSGAVYHGGEEMTAIWREAFGKFVVSNPLHADVFPGQFRPLSSFSDNGS